MQAVVHFNHCLTDICHKKTLNGRRHEEISIRIAFFLATYSSCQFAQEMRGTQILMGQHNCWTLELLFGGWTLSNYVIHFWAHHHLYNRFDCALSTHRILLGVHRDLCLFTPVQFGIHFIRALACLAYKGPGHFGLQTLFNL